MGKNYKLTDLEVYKEALKLTKEIFELCGKPILKKEYSLCDQLKRASVSVPANIAEGYGRRTKADFGQFMSIALGSTNEMLALLDVVGLNFPRLELDQLRKKYDLLGKRIYMFRTRLIS